MVNLPFVVQPKRPTTKAKVGTEESGIIEVERRGYLTSGEKAFVQEVQQYEDSTADLVALSRKISRFYSISLDHAYRLALEVISGTTSDERAVEIEEKFAPELSATLKSLSSAKLREELVMAACLLRYRVNSSMEISDVMELHPDLIAGLAELYREEELKIIDDFTDKEEEAKQPTIEEIEKKPVKATGRSPSKTTTGA